MTKSLSIAFITSTALEDVQQISDAAFTSAVVFTYDTTGAPGYFCLIPAISFAVILSANEQPARLSGMITVFSGLRIFDVSAIKCTPPWIITLSLTLVASIASCRLSPTISATP